MRRLGRTAISPIVSIRDQTDQTISGIRNKLTSLQGAALAIGAGFSIDKLFQSTIGAANELQQQRISLEHFMSVGNAKKNINEIRSMTDQYLSDLRENANLTPFATQEVIAGGTRALQVSKGNTKEAMTMLKIAEDMTALTPGKALGDAMEAIADARMGEFERMKEFGLKFSKEQFDTVGWEGFMAEANALFEGGAIKLSESASGKWSTIMGNIGTSLQNAGTKALDKLMPVMDKVLKMGDGGGWLALEKSAERTVNVMVDSFIWLFNNASKLKPIIDLGKKAIEGFTKVGQQVYDDVVPGFKRLAGTISGIFTLFKGNKDKGMSQLIGAGIDGDVVGGIMQTIKKIKNAVEPIFDFITENKEGITKALSGIVQAFLGFAAVGVIASILTKIGASLAVLTNPIGLIVIGIGLLYTAWKNNFFGIRDSALQTFEFIKPYLETAWGFIKKVFGEGESFIVGVMPVIKEWVIGAWQSIRQFIENVLPTIQNVISRAWDIIESVIETVMTNIVPFIQSTWTIIKNVFMTVAPIIIDVVKMAWEYIMKIIDFVMPYVKSLIVSTWNTVIGAFMAVYNYIASIMPYIQKIISFVWIFLGPLIDYWVNYIWNIIKVGFTFIWNYISLVFTAVKNVISVAWTIISGIFKTALQLLTGDFSGAWDTIKETVIGAIAGIGKLFGDWIMGSITIGKDFVSGIIDGFLSNWSKLTETASKIWDSITGIFNKKKTIDVGVNAKTTTFNALTSGINGSHAKGISNIPFDGYKAELHQGETVLPRDEAEILRSLARSSGNNQTSVTKKILELKQLIGEVNIYNEADEDRLMKKLKKLLQELYDTGGDGVYD